MYSCSVFFLVHSFQSKKMWIVFSCFLNYSKTKERFDCFWYKHSFFCVCLCFFDRKYPRKLLLPRCLKNRGLLVFLWMVGDSKKSHTKLLMMAALCLTARSGKTSQLAEDSKSTQLFLLASRAARGMMSMSWLSWRSLARHQAQQLMTSRAASIILIFWVFLYIFCVEVCMTNLFFIFMPCWTCQCSFRFLMCPPNNAAWITYDGNPFLHYIQVFT